MMLKWLSSSPERSLKNLFSWGLVAAFRLECEGLPHPVRGVPGDDLLFPDPAMLAPELPHPRIGGGRGDLGEFPLLLEPPCDRLDVLHMFRLHLRQQCKHPFGEG